MNTKNLTNFDVTSSRSTCNIISFNLTCILARSVSSSDDNLFSKKGFY